MQGRPIDTQCLILTYSEKACQDENFDILIKYRGSSIIARHGLIK